MVVQATGKALDSKHRDTRCGELDRLLPPHREEGDESEQDRYHATRRYGGSSRKLRLSQCFHNFE